MENINQNYLPYFFKDEVFANGKTKKYLNFNANRLIMDEYYNFSNTIQFNSYSQMIAKLKGIGVNFIYEGDKTHCTIRFNDFEVTTDNFEHRITSAIKCMFFCKILK